MLAIEPMVLRVDVYKINILSLRSLYDLESDALLNTLVIGVVDCL